MLFNTQRVCSLLIVSLFLLAGCNKHARDANVAHAMPPPEVNIIILQPKNLPAEFEYTGQTAGSNETQVRARISGILEKRLYEEGAYIKAGMPLFQIDPMPYQTQLDAAQATAALNQAQFNQAKRESARLMPLAKEKAVSQKEADDANSALEVAQANLQQANARMKEAQLNLAYTKVIAPISGTTGITNKSDGSLITPTDNLLTTLVQTDPIYVNFSITEADYLKINQKISNGKIIFTRPNISHTHWNFSVKVKLADGSIFPTNGTLNFISETVNPTTGGFDARAQITNAQNILHPGQFVRVILTDASYAQIMTIPQRAAIDAPMGKMVFIVTPDNKLAPRPVKLEGWSQGEWIVTEGLHAGDRVLVDGIIKAHDPGMTVKPIPITPQKNG